MNRNFTRYQVLPEVEPEKRNWSAGLRPGVNLHLPTNAPGRETGAPLLGEGRGEGERSTQLSRTRYNSLPPEQGGHA